MQQFFETFSLQCLGGFDSLQIIGTYHPTMAFQEHPWILSRGQWVTEHGKMLWWELREGMWVSNFQHRFWFLCKDFQKSNTTFTNPAMQRWRSKKTNNQRTSLASMHGRRRRRTTFAGTSMQRGAKCHWLCLLSSKSKGLRRKSKDLNDMNCKIHFTVTSNQLVAFFGLL